jgi:hypothetical protein
MLTALIPSKQHSPLNLLFTALALLRFRAGSLPLCAAQFKARLDARSQLCA